jgi:hypothetical protein
MARMPVRDRDCHSDNLPQLFNIASVGFIAYPEQGFPSAGKAFHNGRESFKFTAMRLTVLPEVRKSMATKNASMRSSFRLRPCPCCSKESFTI